jgi:hypothetical protein
MEKPCKFSLPDPYQRAIDSGLGNVEELIEDLAGLARSPGRSSSKPSGSDYSWADRLAAETRAMRRAVRDLRRDLALPVPERDAGRLLLSRCSKLWELLNDLKTSRLRGYGPTPPGLAAYLDPRLDALLASLDRILESAQKNGP